MNKLFSSVCALTLLLSTSSPTTINALDIAKMPTKLWHGFKNLVSGHGDDKLAMTLENIPLNGYPVDVVAHIASACNSRNHEVFDRTLVIRFLTGLGIDALVRARLSESTSATQNLASFLTQAGIGYVLYDHELIPVIVGSSNKFNVSWWKSAALYAFKVSTMYLSAQKVNDGVCALIKEAHKRMTDDSIRIVRPGEESASMSTQA